MQVVLQVRSGPGKGHVFQLKSGQRARVGRSEWCEFPLPEDDLADEHFAVDCGDDGCTIRSVAEESETLVNGKPIGESSLRDGDVVVAGAVEFSVLIVGASESDSESTAVEPEPVERGPATPLEVAQAAGLSDEALALAADAADVGTLVDELGADEKYGDAVRLLAFVLEKPTAVEWAGNCVKDAGGELSAADTAALDAALAWATESTEEHRRAASDAAEATDYSNGATWVALAAFWSGGSLAPEGLPEAPPDEGLTAQAVTGALMMAATTNDDPVEAYGRFIASGRAALDG